VLPDPAALPRALPPTDPAADGGAAPSAAPALRLALLAEPGGGLLALLSDGAALGLVARAPGPAMAALPPALQAALAARDDAALLLQLDPALAGLDWAAAPLGPPPAPALGRRFALRLQALQPAGPPLAADDDLRQVTILSCDLVGSTALMHTLGDEAYAERLVAYHRCVAEAAARHAGRADDPQGDDGFMCYFGWPRAHEDAAANALRAGLAIAAAMGDLGLGVRIGISTGRVVVHQGQPVGAAVHHAARLQALAGAGQVLAGAATRRIAGERFDFALVDPAAQLKGFGASGAVWRVLAERPLLGTRRLAARPRLTPFTGRGDELARMHAHWQAAVAGRRQVLLLRGEAGIGKSRLVHEFRRALQADGDRVLECRCAPEHAGSAFWPLIDLLRRRLGLAPGDPPAQQLARLRALQVARGPQADEALAVLGALLSLPDAVRPPLPPGTGPERLRQLTLAWLEREALGLAGDAPVCLVVEDLHWMDPSTRELLQRLLAGPDEQRLMLLLTQRGSGAADAPGADGLPALPTLALGGLDAEAACSLLRGTLGGDLFGAELARWLAQRGDGVPLFIEESARMAAELAAQRPGDDLGRLLRDSVPATLRDLLLARLDQLPQARRAAQLASALGRRFPRRLLEAVNAHPLAPFRLPAPDDALAALQGAGVLDAPAEAADSAEAEGEGTLSFRHALLRDAAYQTLLARERGALHAAIAAVLQAEFPALCAAQPELLAQHLEAAGQSGPALDAWTAAARHAAQRSAQREATAHARHALQLLAGLPAGAARDAAELRLQRLLAGALIATAGYGADEVGAVYERAGALAAARGDPAALHKVLMGQEAWHFMRGDFDRAGALADAALAALGPSAGPLARLRADWAHAVIRFHRGDLPQALARTDQCLADYGRLGARADAVQDLGVICLCYAGWALWQLGEPDRALQQAQAAVALARRLAHRFGLGQALGFLAVVHHFRGETAAGLDAADAALAVCEAGGFAVWGAHARVLQGRLRVARGAPGDLDAGVQALAQGHALWAATGAVVTRSFHLAMWAEGLLAAGQPQAARQRLDEALALVARHGERFYEPELWRLQGEALRAAGAPVRELRPWLLGALERAQAMQLPPLAARARASLAAAGL